MSKIKVPLPPNAFDPDEPVEIEDKFGGIIEVPIIDLLYGEYGELIEDYNIGYFCEFFGCTIINEEVCKQCGIFWVYFSIMQH